MTLNGRDFAIGVLSVTAVVLFTGLLILQSVSPQPAYGSGQGATSGDYVFSTARLDDTTEVVFAVDTVAQQMNMYAFIPAAGNVQLVQQFDLRALDRANQELEERGGRGGARGNR